jgi:HemY protein
MKILVGLIVIVGALAVAGLAGTLMMRDPGLVVLSYGGHMFETGLWTFLLVLVVLWLAVRFVISTIISLLSSGKIFGRWSARRRRGSAKRQTEQGLLLMAEEEWADARKSLVSGAKGATTPLLNYLQAAYASNELGQTKRRDDLLQQAVKATPDAQFAIDLAAARMQIAGDGSEVDAALETLLKLKNQAPRHQVVAEFIARAYEKKADYSALESQIADLKRMRKEHPQDVARMELAIARHKTLGAYSKDGDAAGALSVWKRTPKETRLDSGFVTEAAADLAAGGANEQAGELLADALSESWNAESKPCKPNRYKPG